MPDAIAPRETRLRPHAAPAHTREDGYEGKPRPPPTHTGKDAQKRVPHSAGGNLAGAAAPENGLVVS